MSDEKKNDGEAADMKGVKTPENNRNEEILKHERQLREEAKKDAKPVQKGAYICIDNIKADGKKYKRGDVYDGKMYAGIEKSLVTKEEWDKRGL